MCYLDEVRMNFYLKNKEADNSAIFAMISFPGRWKYYIGISVSPKLWNKGKQRVKPQHPNHIQVNRVLDAVERKGYDLYLHAIETGEYPTKDEIKHELDVLLLKKKDSKTELIPFIEDFIEQQKLLKKNNTIKNYKGALGHIKSYSEDLTFEDIDLTFFYRFVEHLKDYRQNTIQSTIKNLKVFMQDAYDRGLHSNEAFRHRKFSIAKKEVEKVYLNEEELEKLYRYKFEPRLQKAVNLFLVMSWTGVRYSDLHKIDLSNLDDIEGVECVRLQMKKTGGYITVPLHPMVQNILRQYEYHLPRLSSQKLNLYIKEAVSLVGIEKSPVFCHTARTSMICNLYLAGFPETTIMKMSGHKKYASFQTYINKLTRADHVKVASEFWKNKKSYLRAI